MLPCLGKLEDEKPRSLISNGRDFNVDTGIRVSLDSSLWFFEPRGNRKGIVVVVQVQWQVQYKLLGAGGRTLILNLEWTATIVTPELRTQYHTRHTKENVVYDFSSQKCFDCVRDNLFKNTENQQATKM